MDNTRRITNTNKLVYYLSFRKIDTTRSEEADTVNKIYAHVLQSNFILVEH